MLATLKREMAVMFLKSIEAGISKDDGALAAIIADAAQFSPTDGFRARYMAYMSTLLGRLGDPEGALEASVEAVAADGGAAPAWAARAEAHLALGQLGEGEALRCAEEAARLDPSAGAHELRSRVLHGMGLHDEAAAAIDEGLSLRPGDVKLRQARHHPLMAAGRLEEALAAASDAAADNPKNADAWYVKARLLARLGRGEEALDALTVAAAIHPSGTKPLARKEGDLDPVRGAERFGRIVGGAPRRGGRGRSARRGR